MSGITGPDTLLIWDFDDTVVEGNTDFYYLKHLEPELHDKMAEDRGNFAGWIELVNHYLGLMRERGHGSEAILSSLESIPLMPEMKQVIRFAKGEGHALRILSNANTLFIDRILKKHELIDQFESVTTNHAHIRDDDRIEVIAYEKDKHGCDLCADNLCKGKVVREWEKFERTIYFGDGWGDICPVLGLSKGDYAFVREGMTMAKYLNTTEEFMTEATVVLWDSAADLEARLKEVL